MFLISRGAASLSRVFDFLPESVWQRVYARLLESGWSPRSEAEVAWLESPLSQYRPGSFFTARDAESLADALVRWGSGLAEGLPSGLASVLLELEQILREGAVFITDAAPRRTRGTDSVEVVHVYLCPKCGFMSHGSWLYSTKESTAEEIRSSVEAILAHKYCPLCDCKTLLTEAFMLPQTDPVPLESFGATRG